MWFSKKSKRQQPKPAEKPTKKSGSPVKTFTVWREGKSVRCKEQNLQSFIDAGWEQ